MQKIKYKNMNMNMNMNMEKPKQEITGEKILSIAEDQGVIFENPRTVEEVEIFVRELGLDEEQLRSALNFSSEEDKLIVEARNGNEKEKREDQLKEAEEDFKNGTRDNVAVFLPNEKESEAIGRHGITEFFYGDRELSEEEKDEQVGFELALDELLQNAVKFSAKDSRYIAVSCSKKDDCSKELIIMNFSEEKIPEKFQQLIDAYKGKSESEVEEVETEKLNGESEESSNGLLNNLDFDSKEFKHGWGKELVCTFCDPEYKEIKGPENTFCHKFTLRPRSQE